MQTQLQNEQQVINLLQQLDLDRDSIRSQELSSKHLESTLHGIKQLQDSHLKSGTEKLSSLFNRFSLKLFASSRSSFRGLSGERSLERILLSPNTSSAEEQNASQAIRYDEDFWSTAEHPKIDGMNSIETGLENSYEFHLKDNQAT